jgi:7-carboxy-7-deazaguanine synthase
MEKVAGYGVRHVTVTGGEPLAQKTCLALLKQLCDAGHEVSLETSGAISVEGVDPRVSKVMDFKTPGSGEAAKNRFANIEHLTAHDQVKFVVCDRADYEWSKQITAEHRLVERCEVLFSPSAQQLPARQLADWIVADRLPVRFQIQLHKYLWGDEPGR